MVLVPPERVAPPGKGSARSCVSMPHGRRESHAQHLALLVSVAGFGWTIFEWQRSGARIRAKGTSFVAIGRPALGTPLPERPIAKLLRTVGEHDTLRRCSQVSSGFRNKPNAKPVPAGDGVAGEAVDRAAG